MFSDDEPENEQHNVTNVLSHLKPHIGPNSVILLSVVG